MRELEMFLVTLNTHWHLSYFIQKKLVSKQNKGEGNLFTFVILNPNIGLCKSPDNK